MKKQLNVNAITNELQGGSAFFPGYKQVEQAEETVAEKTTPAPAPLTPAQTPPPAPAVAAPKPLAKSPQPDVQLQRRSFLRRSFDFYEDQIAYLTKVSLEERFAGKDSSINAMLREAVDDYIKKRTHGK